MTYFTIELAKIYNYISIVFDKVQINKKHTEYMVNTEPCGVTRRLKKTLFLISGLYHCTVK